MSIFNQRQIDSIVSAMSQHAPKSKKPYEQIVNTYVDVCALAIRRGIMLANKENLEADQILVNWKHTRLSCGRYGSRGKVKYWFDWLHNHCPIMQVLQKGYRFGSKGKLTMIRTLVDLEILLDCGDPKEIYNEFYQNITEPMDLVPIDLTSLGNFITNTQREITLDNKNPVYLKSIKGHLLQAKLIYSIAEYNKGCLPQIIKESSFGRKYYSGVNLQSTSRVVRHAALGDCHQYDIQVSAFVWKYDSTRAFYPEIKLPATLEYIDSKKSIRQRLAELIFGNKKEHSVNTIKEVMTAIGFGARLTTSGWRNSNGFWQQSALSTIIKSPELRKKFFKDAWVQEFLEEQEIMNKAIFSIVKDNLKTIEQLQNANGSLNRNKTIAYAYQRSERALLNIMTNQTKDNDLLLECHDGFYTRRKLNKVDLVLEMRELLPSVSIDHTEHKKFLFIDNEDFNLHRQHITNEERQARLLNPENYSKDRYSEVTQTKSNQYKIDGYYDGSINEYASMQNYNIDDDPWYEDMDPTEYLELKSIRNKQQHPDWLKELLH